MLAQYFDTLAAQHIPYKGGAWCYEDGLIYFGLEALHRASGDPRWLAHIERLIAPQVGTGVGLAGYHMSDYNIDNIFSGRALLYLHEVSGDEKWLERAGLLAKQLQTQPRTKSGVYWHKLRYPWQIWLDGLYMGLPFQIAYAQRVGAPGLVDDALQQLRTALEITYIPETRLYAHAFDEARAQQWASPKTGVNSAHWARAVGWLAMALVDIAELVGHQKFKPFRQDTSRLLNQIAELRQPSGLWLQVIDQPRLAGNWEETSASAMFAYALLKGQLLGLWDGPGAEIREMVIKRSVASDEGNTLRMVDICHVAGLGTFEGRYRDGTAEYYISEDIITDDPKGVGPLMRLSALAPSIV
ncbi:glycoside hydrolase family 88/105 protein [Shimia sp.]|uniref:glycoside hydrolase family 88/105 protein n=1 Tax=Shimia sp. TaxID=1954381 RepID=UPI003B8B4625